MEQDEKKERVRAYVEHSALLLSMDKKLEQLSKDLAELKGSVNYLAGNAPKRTYAKGADPAAERKPVKSVHSEPEKTTKKRILVRRRRVNEGGKADG
ncbi:hypothetical protein HF563_00235 [Acidithiobacillus ferridurans]|uniref:hypothetical protein n=1 Tax=Acidithiobacillus ferridurans TaxID=1232575 RepID=UPI001C07E38D|nr:hypothetical protein [Acidithiobacillus ferridurans]MBU2717847.1 hypothetical protein [Acidithiobacillus ferridurans]MBU2732611.1 hypothetical protein [Acidithiobacillus ferridurans]